MALTNAEKQARWRERNMISLKERAADIAGKLIRDGRSAQAAQDRQFINDHLKHPDRTPEERLIALSFLRLGG
jgi:hypothetical protein